MLEVLTVVGGMFGGLTGSLLAVEGTMLFLSSSSVGGATHVTGSLMTPHVRRMGPEGRKGLMLSGLTRGTGLNKSIAFFLAVLSLALRLCVPSPGVPARLKSKQLRSAQSPRNLAIWGFERNFFPQGLQVIRKHIKRNFVYEQTQLQKDNVKCSLIHQRSLKMRLHKTSNVRRRLRKLMHTCSSRHQFYQLIVRSFE